MQTKFFSSEPSVSADVAGPLTQITGVTGADSRGTSEGVRPLTEDERRRFKQSFEDDGYFIVRNVVSKEKLSVLRATLMDEFESARRSGRLISGGGGISGHLNSFPGEGSRFAYDALVARGIVDLIRDIYPGSIGTPNVGCNLNLPKSVAQHYHVDSSFLDHFMVVNVALVDTDLANGAIEVTPGTHRKFYKFWRFAVERPHRFSKRLPLGQGDVLVRASTLWHRGMPNHTTTPRPMLAFTLGQGQSEQQRLDPFRVNDGKIMFYENWYRPNMLGRLRERTFVVAPFTYSAYRFVRSLFGNKGYATP